MIGPVEQAEGEEQKVADGETVRLKRFLRRYLRSTQKLKKRLKDGPVIMVRPNFIPGTHTAFGFSLATTILSAFVRICARS
jgi:hypothetical protein